MKRQALFVLIYCCVFFSATFGQQTPSAATSPNSLQDLFDLIDKRSRDFSFPNLDDTVTVATIDLSRLSAAEIGFSFNIPIYDSGKYSYPNPNFREEPSIPVLHDTAHGGVLNLANELHVNLKFRIQNWTNSPGTKLIMILGERIKTLDYGDTVAIFLDVKTANPSISIRAVGFKISDDLLKMDPQYYRGKQALVYGLVPFKINRKNLSLGVITLPVIPLSITYAPPVDLNKTNSASSSQKHGIGNVTSISFTSEKSTTSAYQTTFDDVKSTQDFLNTTSEIYSKIPLPITQGIAKAASEISTALGSAEGTQNISNSIHEEHSTSILLEKTITVNTSAIEGGPGMGDIFVYYRNAKLLWRLENGKIFLTLLGADPIEQVSAAKLKQGLQRLKAKPKGTKDRLLGLDANSISQLLMLDPVANIGGGVKLTDSKRFRLLDSWHVTSGNNKQSYKYAITTQDLSNSSQVTTNIESDKEGKLAALGLGVNKDMLLEARISQSNSQKLSTLEEVSDDFTLNGDGFSVNNSVKIYFDTIFNSYIFQMINTKK